MFIPMTHPTTGILELLQRKFNNARMNRAKLRIRTLFFFFTLAALLWGLRQRTPPAPASGP